jgi:midasin
MALAAATGHPIERVNLSEQTDVMDLFGTDLPVEGKVRISGLALGTSAE